MRTLARNPAAWGKWSRTRPAGLAGRLLMLAICILGLLAVGPLRPVRGDQPAEALTAEQRQQRERRATALNDAAMHHYVHTLET